MEDDFVKSFMRYSCNSSWILRYLVWEGLGACN